MVSPFECVPSALRLAKRNTNSAFTLLSLQNAEFFNLNATQNGLSTQRYGDAKFRSRSRNL